MFILLGYIMALFGTGKACLCYWHCPISCIFSSSFHLLVRYGGASSFDT